MRYKVLEVSIDDVTLDEAATRIVQMYSSAWARAVFYCNPEILVAASRDKAFRDIVQSANLLFPDGFGLKLFGRLVGASFRERIAGADLMLRVCQDASRLGKSVFFLGGRNGTAQGASMAIQRMFPALEVAGWCDGFEGLKMWKENRALHRADVVFVGLGSPLQEEWIFHHLRHLSRIRVAMAVGGAFDMLSGATPRAPRFMQKAGLEWLWRFVREPRKRFKRIVNAVIIFPFLVFREAMLKPKQRSTHVK